MGRLAWRNRGAGKGKGTRQNTGFQAGHGSKVGLAGFAPVEM